MSLLEKVWILISILIILIILSTDPKNSTPNTLGNQLSAVFASASDGQKSLRTFNWVLIVAFFLITLSLSYFV